MRGRGTEKPWWKRNVTSVLESEPHVTIIDSRLIVAFTVLQMANHPLHWLFYLF